MTWSRRKLEVARWVSAALAIGSVLVTLEMPQLRSGWPGGLLFVFFILTGFPAAMLTLHLHPPKWLKYLERP